MSSSLRFSHNGRRSVAKKNKVIYSVEVARDWGEEGTA